VAFPVLALMKARTRVELCPNRSKPDNLTRNFLLCAISEMVTRIIKVKKVKFCPVKGLWGC
jgi:hypothetical protein